MTKPTLNGAWRALRIVALASLFASQAFAAADLEILTESSNLTPVAGGAAYAYTLTITNHGPDAAENVFVTDPLPPSVLFQNVSVVNNPATPGFGLTCYGPPVGTNGVVICEGDMPAPGMTESAATVTIVAQIDPETASGVRTNTAQVTSDTQEASPNTGANSSAVQVNVQVSAPLSVSVQATPQVYAGDPIHYLVSLNNGGSTTAINATLTHSLPAGARFLYLHGTGALHATCNANGGGTTVTCTGIEVPLGLHRLVVIAETSADPSETPPGLLPTEVDINPGTGTGGGVPSGATTLVVAPEPPYAAPDKYHTDPGVQLVINPLGVKNNDSDDEDLLEVLVVNLVAGPGHGNLVLLPDGSFSYTPDANYIGLDSFKYTLTDSRGLVSNEAVVRIVVGRPAPVPLSTQLAGLIALVLLFLVRRRLAPTA